MKQPKGLTKRRIVWYSLVTVGLCTVTAPVSAASTTEANISIQPLPCVIDLVQDGSQQAIQTGSVACDDLLPDLVTPVYGQPSLPIFEGDFVGDSEVVVRARQPNQPWSPIASTVQSGQSSQKQAATVMAVAGGVGTALAVSALGVDAALFEMRHSKQATRWIKSRIRP